MLAMTLVAMFAPAPVKCWRVTVGAKYKLTAYVRIPTNKEVAEDQREWGECELRIEQKHGKGWIISDRKTFPGWASFVPPTFHSKYFKETNHVPHVWSFGSELFVVCPLLSFTGNWMPTELVVFRIRNGHLRSVSLPHQLYGDGGAYVDPQRKQLTIWGSAYEGSHAQPTRMWVHFTRFRYRRGRFRRMLAWNVEGQSAEREGGFAVLRTKPYTDHWAVSPGYIRD